MITSFSSAALAVRLSTSCLPAAQDAARMAGPRGHTSPAREAGSAEFEARQSCPFCPLFPSRTRLCCAYDGCWV